QSWRSDSTAGGHSGGTVTGAHVTGDMGHFRPAFWVKKVPALTDLSVDIDGNLFSELPEGGFEAQFVDLLTTA
ncbi:hypothetical protein, partial [Caproicibacter fermentans]|uniref:hypothetical protein n=1 Tax=Caproicibacter fermentans TaxID=2576756 RepID=UPI001A9BF120